MKKTDNSYKVVDIDVLPFSAELLVEKAEEHFKLVILTHGDLHLEIGGASVAVHAPALICLHERKSIFLLRHKETEGFIICFKPTFLNVNMTLSVLHNPDFDYVAEKHSFCQMRPFLSDDPQINIWPVSNEVMEEIIRYTHHCATQLGTRADWYWACRARSYFLDIIRTIENMYYDHGISPEVEKKRLAASSPTDIRQIIEYVDTHLDQKLTLEELCTRFHTYRGQIEKLFRDAMDVSFYEYVKAERLKKVCYYLRFTDLRVTEIAERVGFSSPQNLAKFFMKSMQISMKDFRRQSVEKRKADLQLQHMRSSG